MVTSLSRSGPSIPPFGGGAPKRGPDKAVIAERQRLGDFIAGHLNVTQLELNPDIDVEIDALTVAERTFMEIQMAGKDTRIHSFDYDPLASGR